MTMHNSNAVNAEHSEQGGAQSNVSRLSSQASIEMPKKVKKAQDAFRTISEVADKLNVQQHVLRFWETKFSQIRPLKRGGGRRYYRPDDVALLERIHYLLYTQGYTIKGVQKLLKEQGKSQVIAQAQNSNENQDPVSELEAKSVEVASVMEQSAVLGAKPNLSPQQRVMLEIMLDELKAIRALVKE